MVFTYSMIVIIPVLIIYIARPGVCISLTGDQVINPAWTTNITYRLEFFSLALDMIKERPALGVGPGNYFTIAAQLFKGETYLLTHAHNIYLHIAAERGLISLLAGILLVMIITSDLLLMSRHTETAAAGLGALVIVSIQGLADVPTLEPLVMRYFLIMLALALAAANKGIRENENTV